MNNIIDISNGNEFKGQFQQKPQVSNIAKSDQQSQQYQQKYNLEEEQAIIQYYIYEDFQNFLNLIYSLQAIKQHFDKDPKNIMIQICKNKLITQMNISNTIHFDLYTRYQEPELQKNLIQEKQKLRSQFKSIIPKGYESEILFYEQNCLGDQVTMNQKELKKVELQTNFNEKVVQQILADTRIVDLRMNQIRNTKHYRVPTLQEMKQTAENYKTESLKKLQNQQKKR